MASIEKSENGGISSDVLTPEHVHGPSEPSTFNSQHPSVSSLSDLTIIEAWDPTTNSAKYMTFYLITPNEDVYFGRSTKNKRELTLQEFSAALEHVPDEELYPEIPTSPQLTIAPADLPESSTFIKRPGFTDFEHNKDGKFIPKAMLDETIVMEQISKPPHPNIVHYHGCRVKGGRITAIVLEKLERTLNQYVDDNAAEGTVPLNNEKFVEALESAVGHLHSMGIAHNDINPANIMVRDDGTPVLIDFGSAGPYGQNLQSLGTRGWYEEVFFTSEQKHDIYALKKLREWLQEKV